MERFLYNINKEHYCYSKYNYSGSLSDGRVLLYNLVSSSVAFLSLEEFESIQDNSRSVYDATLFDECIKNGFLVPVEENETEKIIFLRNANNFNSRTAGFQILPTTFCNARCFYCYEKNFVGNKMSEETVKEAIDFIKEYSAGFDSLNITWFGGEPFLEDKVIKQISKGLISFCDERGIGYFADAISNGSLINESNISRIYDDYRIRRIQITIDGRNEEHINRKNYIDKNITYETLLQRIAALSKYRIKVLVRLNVDKNNVEGILGVIDDLGNLEADFDNIVVYASPLYSTSKKNECLDKQQLSAVFKDIYHRLIDNGFIRTIDGLPMNYMNAVCAAKGANNYVIAPNGDIYKCEHLLGHNEEAVGNVKTGIVYNDTLAKWNKTDLSDECYKCKHLPICQSGCEAAETQGFGYGRCSYITFIDDVIIDAANYLMKGGKK